MSAPTPIHLPALHPERVCHRGVNAPDTGTKHASRTSGEPRPAGHFLQPQPPRRPDGKTRNEGALRRVGLVLGGGTRRSVPQTETMGCGAECFPESWGAGDRYDPLRGASLGKGPGGESDFPGLEPTRVPATMPEALPSASVTLGAPERLRSSLPWASAALAAMSGQVHLSKRPRSASAVERPEVASQHTESIGSEGGDGLQASPEAWWPHPPELDSEDRSLTSVTALH